MDTLYKGLVVEIAEKVKEYVDEQHAIDIDLNDVSSIINYTLRPFIDCMDQQDGLLEETNA